MGNSVDNRVVDSYGIGLVIQPKSYSACIWIRRYGNYV